MGLPLSSISIKPTMREIKSDYGQVIVGTKEELFQQALDLGLKARAQTTRSRFLWALTGGGTPKEWYQWLVSGQKITPTEAAAIEWTVSDERHVLLSSSESNFGNAERQFLAPLEVPTDRRHPWMVAWPVAEAAVPDEPMTCVFWVWATIATPRRFSLVPHC
jgi:6-phosphogluconolactonase